MEQLRSKKGFICDMDGVIYHGGKILPGVENFVQWLYDNDKKFLFLTNNSSNTPLELKLKLQSMGLDVDESHFYTSALATAKFVAKQKHHAKAFVIGQPGLIGALYNEGVAISDTDPDFVIIGDATQQYNYEMVCKAVKFVNNGARLIGTNTDMTVPITDGILPSCHALVSPIELATNKKAYFVGKPNPLMMRTALNILGIHSEEAAMIGDNMDTDVIAGIESGLDTALVLTGVSTRETVEQYPYRPRLILNGVADIADPSIE
ncbi:MAG: HAD-IIA family hydrolase [Eubacteriales bacterium]|nr:HAD-IIA family hydrolase [Eubacteriales bacterium]